VGTHSPRTLLARKHTAPIESVAPRPRRFGPDLASHMSSNGTRPSRDPQADHYQHLITRGTERLKDTLCASVLGRAEERLAAREQSFQDRYAMV